MIIPVPKCFRIKKNVDTHGAVRAEKNMGRNTPMADALSIMKSAATCSPYSTNSAKHIYKVNSTHEIIMPQIDEVAVPQWNQRRRLSKHSCCA
jgi:hypothetical protein